MATAAECFEVSVEDMRGRVRKKEVVLARHAFCLAARTLTGKPLKEIAATMGRDHATALNSCRVAINMRETKYGDFYKKYKYLNELLT